ncbi:hypothetical protein Q1695_000569 [Nippostrongylus brasiliensis]|nr:hypothetical protein Q1695_000569 [Nippostrongylus brasiliensis]
MPAQMSIREPSIQKKLVPAVNALFPSSPRSQHLAPSKVLQYSAANCKPSARCSALIVGDLGITERKNGVLMAALLRP